MKTVTRKEVPTFELMDVLKALFETLGLELRVITFIPESVEDRNVRVLPIYDLKVVPGGRVDTLDRLEELASTPKAAYKQTKKVKARK